MFYNDTRRQINVLAEKMMKGNRCRNIFVIIAIAMTTFLISSIISIGSGYLKSAGRQQQMFNGTIWNSPANSAPKPIPAAKAVMPTKLISIM